MKLTFANTAVTASFVALLYLVAFQPSAQDLALIWECEDLEWITDTCVESPYFWEYNK